VSKLNVGKVAFVGAGNMAAALVGGMVRGALCPPQRIFVSDVQPERIALFEKDLGVRGAPDNSEAVKGAQIVVMAVKPQMMNEVLAGLRAALGSDALVISIAAGIRTERIEKALGEGRRVVRVMPNTPALVRAGAAAICAGRWATESDMAAAEQILGAVGLVVRVREEDMDAVTAVSGSGPAYVFYLIEAMLKAAKELGLEDAAARKLAYATVAGAAQLITETGTDAAELRQKVTSKGGTTAAAVDVLDRAGVGKSLVEAVLAAHRRSRELSAM
jgi:pyrroline-5-carboxylate reductase